MTPTKRTDVPYIPSEEVRFTMRLNAQCYLKVKEQAKKMKRSIAKQIEFMLERDLEATETR